MPTGVYDHKERAKKVPEICTVENCSDPFLAKGLCRKHYQRLKKTGKTELLDRRERGTGTFNNNGYYFIKVKGHANAGKKGYIREHTFVMSQHLGRPLKPNENVHHKNGIRTDNRLENLELWVTSQPKGQRIEDMIEFCTDFLKEYAPELLKPQ